jgi:hypothetical protein
MIAGIQDSPGEQAEEAEVTLEWRDKVVTVPCGLELEYI